MAEQCRWTVTDADGNKYDVRRARILGADGREREIGPARGRERGALSWSKAERMLRRGTGALVLDVPGMGGVRLQAVPADAGGTLVTDRKVRHYRWGCPDGAAVRGVSADGSVVWRDPTAAERTAIADSLLVSTLARVNSASSESPQHARAVADAAVSRFFGDSDILRPDFPLRGNMVVRKLTAGLIRTTGDGDERAALLAVRSAARSAVHEGMKFGPEAALAIREFYPHASTLEAMMLAAGVVHKDSGSYRRFSDEADWEMRQAKRMREERAQAHASRLELLSSGKLRAVPVGGEEGLYGGVVRDELSLSRVEARRGYLQESARYENMPFLPELVRAAAGYSEDPKRFEDVLFRAEAAYPGAALWAAAHSGDASLQSAAVMSLPVSADVQYVRAVAWESQDKGTWEALSAAARSRLAEDPGLSPADVSRQCKRAWELLGPHPDLRASEAFMRSLFDAAQDASQPDIALARTAEMMFPVRDDVPEWFFSESTIERAVYASKAENVRAAWRTNGDGFFTSSGQISQDEVVRTLPVKVRNLSDLASGLQLIDEGVEKFFEAAPEYEEHGGIMNYWVRSVIDEIGNAPGGKELVEGMVKFATAAARPNFSYHWRGVQYDMKYTPEEYSALRKELTPAEKEEFDRLSWSLEGLVHMNAYPVWDTVLEVSAGPLPAGGDGFAWFPGDTGRALRRELAGHVVKSVKGEFAGRRADAEKRYRKILASAGDRLAASASEEARRRAGLSL